MPVTKAWDWTKNEDQQWLVPCPDSAYLAESWQSKGYGRLLDLGCGLGRHAIYLARHGFDVTAVDLSDYGVNYLRDWADRENLTIRTAVCNMLALPFPDHSFDCILAYNVIYHTDTSGFLAVLKEIRRVLKPGGELYITLISKNTYSFQHAEQYRRIDANTLLRDEDETERNVPHFYVDIQDICHFFADWHFVNHPLECAAYKIEKPEYCSRHWTLLVRAKSLQAQI